MSGASEYRRNNVRAGLFVVIGLALAISTFITLQKLQFGAKSPYRLRFSVENGVSGLFAGSEVRVGGLRRGRVLAITPVTEEGVLSRIEVDIELDAAITLYRNAQVVRVAPILGNTSWLNFNSTGGPADTNGDGELEPVERLQPGETLAAIEEPGLLANVMGSKSASQFVTIIERAETFSEILAEAPGDYRNKVVPALDSAAATLAQLRSDYEGWRTKVGATLDAAAKAAGNLEQGTQEANTLIADARETLAENRPNLLTTTRNLADGSGSAKEVVEAVKAETLPQVARLLGEGERAISELGDLLDRADVELAARLPDIRAFLSDLRVATAQLKLATIEVRRSPWRLLYRPSTDVLAHEQLYEATRSFAAATTEMRSAAESLQEVMRARPDVVDNDPELRARLRTTLLDSISRYEEAQRRLYGVLLGEP